MKRIRPNYLHDEAIRRRYPGTRPFGDSPEDYVRFFGRHEESEQLYLRVLSVSLLLQFATSGLGKTSLLQASLFPRLRQKPFLPVMVRLNEDNETLVDAVLRSFKQACTIEALEFPDVQKDGLWELLSTALVWREEFLLTPVLVFDQFEEVFTLRDGLFRLELAEELGALVTGVPPSRLRSNASDALERFGVRPDVKIVISLREDYLGALEEFSPVIPNLFQERLRLEPLTERAARQAITNPSQLVAKEGEEQFWTSPFDFEAAALDRMVTFLKGKSGVIEPFTLQLLCRHAEGIAHGMSDGREERIPLTAAEFDGAEDFGSVLNNFYHNVLDKLPKSSRTKAEELCEHGLLDRDGRRLPLAQQEIMTRFGVGAETLDILAGERLVRRERRLESVFYEISHDRLAGSIFAFRRNKLPEKEQKRIRALKFFGAAVSVLCLVLLAATVTQAALMIVGIVSVGYFAFTVFNRPFVTAEDGPLPPRYMTLPGQYRLGVIAYVSMCLLTYGLIVSYYGDILPFVVLPELVVKLTPDRSLSNPIVVGAVLVMLLNYEADWNPLSLLRRIVWGWISIPTLANRITAAASDALMVPEEERRAVASDPGNHVDIGDFDKERRSVDRIWAELCYVRLWLTRNLEQGSHLTFFNEPIFAWRTLESDFFVMREKIAPLRIAPLRQALKEESSFDRDAFQEIAHRIETLRRKYCRLGACFILFKNANKEAAIREADQFGARIPIIENRISWLRYVNLFVVAVLISISVGLWRSATLWDIAQAATNYGRVLLTQGANYYRLPLLAMALVLVVYYAAGVFRSPIASPDGPLVPRYMTQRRQYLMGMIVYVVMCLIAYALIVGYCRELFSLLALVAPSQIRAAMDTTIAQNSISFPVMIGLGVVVLVTLLRIEHEWNPLFALRRLVWGWVYIPALANQITAAASDALMVPEEKRWAVASDPGNHVDIGDFDKERRSVDRIWAELCYVRLWLRRNLEQGSHLTFFNEPSFAWRTLESDFAVMREKIAPLRQALKEESPFGHEFFESTAEKVETLRRKYCRLAASFIVFNNETKKATIVAANELGASLARIEIRANPIRYAVLFIVAILISIYLGVWLSATMWDLSHRVATTGSVFNQDADIATRWVYYGVATFGTPIVVVLLLRYLGWNYDAAQPTSYLTSYAAMFVVALCVSVASLAMLTEFVSPISPPFVELVFRDFKWGWSPALICVYVLYHVDRQIDPLLPDIGTVGGGRIAPRLFACLSFAALVTLLSLWPATTLSVGPGSAWPIEKLQTVVVGMIFTIAFSMAVVSHFCLRKAAKPRTEPDLGVAVSALRPS
jgi:hypothetical protein